MSTLHASDDPTGYERADERWCPVHTASTIVLSFVTLLANPSDEFAADIDGAKMLRESPKDFKKKAAECVKRSVEAVPMTN